MLEGTWPDLPSRAPPGFTWDETRDSSAPSARLVCRPQSLSTSALWVGVTPVFQGVCFFDSRGPSIRQAFIPSGAHQGDQGCSHPKKIDWIR